MCNKLRCFWPLQVQQQFVNAEGQLVSVHQVDQHLVYPGVPQQQLMTPEVAGSHPQVTQIPGQQVYLQQVKYWLPTNPSVDDEFSIFRCTLTFYLVVHVDIVLLYSF